MELKGVHPDYPVTVTPAKKPWCSAFVGQRLFRLGGDLYGGTLKTFIADGGSPEDSNELANELAVDHNSKATKRFPPIPQPLKA